ncbi:MAG TPA: iron chelate uptake ABC transporter family permease subunit [Tepidisphaeraceae bacterium]|jgi:manganese/zinc/iron transport system permease protein
MSVFYEDLVRTLSLQDYNTRVVVFGTAALGIACGVVGAFMLLRKRALMGDALSHATFPGLCLAYIVFQLAWGTGRSLPVLLGGAAISGIIGVGCVLAIRNLTRIKEDAAMGIVLSVFFGFGTVLRDLALRMNTGSAAGLDGFIYGRTASMVAGDAWAIGGIALLCTIVLIIAYKELRLLCFDAAYARGIGRSVVGLDVLLMSLVTIVTVVGLQAVGLILVIALLIIPPAAARFWTHRLGRMVVLSALIGAVSAVVGAVISAVLADVPSGAVIVLTAAAFFCVSVVIGSEQGLAVVAWRRAQMRKEHARPIGSVA